jgi:hypothetical protein
VDLVVALERGERGRVNRHQHQDFWSHNFAQKSVTNNGDE